MRTTIKTNRREHTEEHLAHQSERVWHIHVFFTFCPQTADSKTKGPLSWRRKCGGWGKGSEVAIVEVIAFS